MLKIYEFFSAILCASTLVKFYVCHHSTLRAIRVISDSWTSKFLYKIISLLNLANPDRGLMITTFARESGPDVDFKIDLRRGSLTLKLVEKIMRSRFAKLLWSVWKYLSGVLVSSLQKSFNWFALRVFTDRCFWTGFNICHNEITLIKKRKPRKILKELLELLHIASSNGISHTR